MYFQSEGTQQMDEAQLKDFVHRVSRIDEVTKEYDECERSIEDKNDQIEEHLEAIEKLKMEVSTEQSRLSKIEKKRMDVTALEFNSDIREALIDFYKSEKVSQHKIKMLEDKNKTIETRKTNFEDYETFIECVNTISIRASNANNNTDCVDHTDQQKTNNTGSYSEKSKLKALFSIFSIIKKEFIDQPEGSDRK